MFGRSRWVPYSFYSEFYDEGKLSADIFISATNIFYHNYQEGSNHGINWVSVFNGVQNINIAGILYGVGSMTLVIPELNSKIATAICYLGAAGYGIVGSFDVLVGLTGNKGPSEYFSEFSPLSDAIQNVYGI
jgi:hypothetical protein